MQPSLSRTFLLSGLLLLTAGCAGLALRASPSLLEHMSCSLFEECDPELARQAMPAQLKLLEGLLGEAPRYPKLLITLCEGFTGYAMLFVEEDAPGRASLLYARGAKYGFAALGLDVDLTNGAAPTGQSLAEALGGGSAEQTLSLFWSTLAWYGWLGLNRDRPAALGQLPDAHLCLERLLASDPEFFGGTPYLLAAVEEASKPALLGGDPGTARALFEKAMAVKKGDFFLVPYHYARDFAVRVQDRALFHRLLANVVATPPDRLPEFCLPNAVIRNRALRLLDRENELFF